MRLLDDMKDAADRLVKLARALKSLPDCPDQDRHIFNAGYAAGLLLRARDEISRLDLFASQAAGVLQRLNAAMARMDAMERELAEKDRR